MAGHTECLTNGAPAYASFVRATVTAVRTYTLGSREYLKIFIWYGWQSISSYLTKEEQQVLIDNTQLKQKTYIVSGMLKNDISAW